jgi:hypothetical protein
MIEQAIFTSARTDRSRGYQLVAASPGIDSEDARILATWGPSHGSLCDAGPGGSSVNFYPLPSGRWCIGHSVAAGEEYSGRGGYRLYTRSFVVGSETLARFANNPFALVRVIRGRGLLSVENSPATTLPPIELPGDSPAVDEGVLSSFVELLGTERVAWLVESLFTAESLIIVGRENRELLLAGLLNCFPLECRLELSFATGLIYSPRRPFRINALATDSAEVRRLKRHPQISVFEVNDEPPADFCPTGWAAYLFEAIAIDGLTIVASELEQPRPGLRLAELSDLADRLTHGLHEARHESVNDDLSRFGAGRRGDPPSQSTLHWPQSGDSGESDGELPGGQSQPRFRSAGVIGAPRLERSGGPSTTLAAPSREVLEQLERLDDLVFETINGRRPALDELTRCWPSLAKQLPADLLAESREQYLRYSIKLWQSRGDSDFRDPAWAVAALDVLCVLFGGD